MSEASLVREGSVPFRGEATWYKIIDGGDATRVPVLILHGGPGFPHDYLEPYEDLAASGRDVIFYDQIGCGNSAITSDHDPSMWTVELFVEELGAVRKALGLERVHLLGQSWGSMLAMEYLLTNPSGVVSLVSHSGTASASVFTAGARSRLDELPEEVKTTIIRFEEAKDFGPAYDEALLPFYQRFICRLDPWPEYVHRTLEKVRESPEVYMTMWGPSDFTMLGTLSNWDITDRLGEIALPTLLMSGRYDEVVPETVRPMNEAIRDSEWVLFEESAHLLHAEEPERCMAIVTDFLDRAEAQAV